MPGSKGAVAGVARTDAFDVSLVTAVSPYRRHAMPVAFPTPTNLLPRTEGRRGSRLPTSDHSEFSFHLR